MKVKYSQHARQRMKLRDVSFSSVYNVLKFGSYEIGKGGAFNVEVRQLDYLKHWGEINTRKVEGIRLVVSINGGGLTIITVIRVGARLRSKTVDYHDISLPTIA